MPATKDSLLAIFVFVRAGCPHHNDRFAPFVVQASSLHAAIMRGRGHSPCSV